MTSRDIDLAVKPKYDGKEVTDGISIAGDDFRKLVVDAKTVRSFVTVHPRARG